MRRVRVSLLLLCALIGSARATVRAQGALLSSRNALDSDGSAAVIRSLSLSAYSHLLGVAQRGDSVVTVQALAERIPATRVVPILRVSTSRPTPEPALVCPMPVARTTSVGDAMPSVVIDSIPVDALVGKIRGCTNPLQTR